MNINHIVLDTNVLYSALMSANGASSRIFDGFLKREYDLYCSDSIFIEYSEVLHEDSPPLSAAKINRALKAIKEMGIFCIPHKREFASIDPDDHMFYDVAMLANAYLITWNVKHYPNESLIKTPNEFLELHK